MFLNNLKRHRLTRNVFDACFSSFCYMYRQLSYFVDGYEGTNKRQQTEQQKDKNNNTNLVK